MNVEQLSPDGKRRGWLLAILVVLLPLVALAAVIIFSGGDDETPEVARGEIMAYTIANGTFDRINNGETVAIIPVPMYMKLGDVLQIKNEDGYTHTVGPFVIRPGETLEHQFVKTGTYVGACTVHPSGRAEIIVS